MANNSAFAVAVNVFTAPGEAFAAIRERPRIFFPLLVMLCGFAATSFVYTQKVDLSWLIETQLQASSAQMTEAQREQTVAAVSKVPPSVAGTFAALSTDAFIALVAVLTALYYTIVSLVTGDGIKFKLWFSLVCWCMFPLLIQIVATLVHLNVVDVRFLPQDSVNPLSFGSLLSMDRTGATLVQRILLGLDIATLWSVALSVLGYQAFTKSSLTKAAAVVLGPLAAFIVLGSLYAQIS